jgi:antitoxin CcdA
MRMESVMSGLKVRRRALNGVPGKRATNLTLSSDVLDAAKLMGMNISQLCDNYLREVVRREQERKWREEHADFVAAYNATVEAEGLPLDQWRSF